MTCLQWLIPVIVAWIMTSLSKQQSNSLEHVRDVPLAAMKKDPLINWNSNDNCEDGDGHWISCQSHQLCWRDIVSSSVDLIISSHVLRDETLPVTGEGKECAIMPWCLQRYLAVICGVICAVICTSKGVVHHACIYKKVISSRHRETTLEKSSCTNK